MKDEIESPLQVKQVLKEQKPIRQRLMRELGISKKLLYGTASDEISFITRFDKKFTNGNFWTFKYGSDDYKRLRYNAMLFDAFNRYGYFNNRYDKDKGEFLSLIGNEDEVTIPVGCYPNKDRSNGESVLAVVPYSMFSFNGRRGWFGEDIMPIVIPWKMKTWDIIYEFIVNPNGHGLHRRNNNFLADTVFDDKAHEMVDEIYEKLPKKEAEKIAKSLF